MATMMSGSQFQHAEFEKGKIPIEEQIITDHREVKSLYQQYKQSGDIKFYNQFVWELVRHSIAEEILLYPMLEKMGDRNVTKLKAEHLEVNKMLKQMEGMNHPSAQFDEMFDLVMKDVESHADDEETKDLAWLKREVPLDERIRKGDSFMSRKKIVPTHPHTATAQDNPILGEALGLLIAPIDKFRDLFREFPDQH